MALLRHVKSIVRLVVGEATYLLLSRIKARLRHLRRLITRADPWVRPRRHCCQVEKHGEWYLCPDGLTSDSIVYSLGIGRDVEFDLSVISRFGAEVFAFDPTPAAVEWIRCQTLPRGFHVHELGVAGYDGVAHFRAPGDPLNPSYVFGGRDLMEGEVVTCEVRRLQTLMAQLGHDHVHLLKMDIEGAEYEVIQDFLAEGVRVDQFLVEFHHRKPGIGAKRTADAVENLRRNGFELFHISPAGTEFAFRHFERNS